MMYQPVENTAFCLNCTNEWLAVWGSKELSLVCPRCRWRLGVPRDFVSSGWWTTQEHHREASDTEADRRRAEEEYRKKQRERAEFARDVRKDLDRLLVIELARIDHRGRKGGAER